ncbi:MAG: MFS transporter [Chromatiales bacterium]
MTPTERRAAFGLAGIYGFRMLGLFLILPVFALYTEHLEGATPLLIGLAIGAYGLTQAILQLPFGLLSDRIGRKPVIFGGLLLFAIGSVVAALADDIWLIIIGRAIQGSGAVAAAVMALAADLTRDSQRTKAMATIGMTIGTAFALSLVAGPFIDAYIGISGIFWLTTVLAVLGMLVLMLVVPTPVSQHLHRDAQPVPAMFKRVLGSGELLRLDFGIFSLHLILTAMFLAMPLLLRDLGLPVQQHSLLYLPVLLLSVGAMVPFIIMAEKHGKMKTVFSGAVATILVALLLMYFFPTGYWLVGLFLLLFFSGFNLLESTLPSLISKVAPADAKGTAMGVYSTSQFMGGFVGGVAGGWVHQQFGYVTVFLAAAGLAVVWLGIALTMRTPGQYSSRVLAIQARDREQSARLVSQLSALEGVVEAVVIAGEQVAYLKVDRKKLNESELEAVLAAGSS